MKKEIEVKAKVKNLEDISQKIISLGSILSEPITQDDAIFVNLTGSFTDFKRGENFLRIRKNNQKILFTVKQPQKNELDCIEHEVEVSDAEELQNILELMGYHEAVQVHKVRRKAKYKDYEICLDEVRDLGSFIEVEKITDGDGEKVQEELFLFLESLGVQREDRVVHGYDTLVYLNKNPK
jgi:adenylate cyclase class 2